MYVLVLEMYFNDYYHSTKNIYMCVCVRACVCV